jgi:hypothetical protein
MVVLLLLTLIITLANCEDVGPSTQPGQAPSPSRSSPSVGCEESVGADPAWRNKSTVVGPFGLYGRGRDFRSVKRDSRRSDYVTKIPVVIEGQQIVTLSVPASERRRVSLIYRRAIFGAHKVPNGDSSITFVPCSGSKLTAWAGGLILHDRSEVHLEVTVAGREARTISVGR